MSSTMALPTATVTVAPPPVYLDVSMESLSIVNIAILLASITIAVMFGFNRLVAVPIIASFCGIMDNSLDWYSYASSYPLANKRVALVAADICWGTQDAVLTLYSFFLLEKLLRGRQRLSFMLVFALLFTAVVGLRATILGMHQITLTDETLNDTVDRVTRAYFLALALLEALSATFLLRVFYSASGGSKFVGGNAGLFKRLAHSSELRVATLAGIGITRAACYGSSGRIPDGFDNAAYIMQNAFPIALLIDLLTSRVTKLQITADASKAPVGASNGSACRCACTCGRRSNGADKTIASQRSRPLSNVREAGAKENGDQEGQEFRVYVGKSWTLESSVSAAPMVTPTHDVRGV